jgi:thymidine kinase
MEYSQCGYLKIILGPMFAGKTSELIRIHQTYVRSVGENAIAVINYADDKRYDNKDKVEYIVTHDKQKLPSLSFYNLINFIDEINLSKYQVILINEGQFFKDLYTVVDLLVNKHKKKVYVCGLDGDYKRQRFGDILDLISLADEVIKLKSICTKCKNDAIFTHRISKKNDNQYLIGDAIYEPLCRSCYNIFNSSSLG